jgi:hypothetical protein
MQTCGTPRDAVSKPSWWSTIFPLTASLDATPSPAQQLPTPPPRAHSARCSPTATSRGNNCTGAWQSKPVSSLPSGTTSTAGAAAKPPPAPAPHAPVPGYARRAHGTPEPAPAAPSVLSAEGIAAGLSEGLLQFTGYLRGDLKRRSSHQNLSAASSPEVSGEASAVANKGERMGRSRLGRNSRQGSSAQVSEAGWESVAAPDESPHGLWQVMWKDGDTLRTLPFRSAPETRAHIQRMVRALITS